MVGLYTSALQKKNPATKDGDGFFNKNPAARTGMDFLLLKIFFTG
jgi:hypothetical protein